MIIKDLGAREVKNYGRINAIRIKCTSLLDKLNKVSNSNLSIGSVFEFENNVIAVTDEDEFTLVVSGTGIKSLDRIVDKIIIPEYRLLTLNPNNKEDFKFKEIDRPDGIEKTYKKLYYPYIYYTYLTELMPTYFNKDKVMEIKVEGLLTETFLLDGYNFWIDSIEYDPNEDDYYQAEIEKAISIQVSKILNSKADSVSE